MLESIQALLDPADRDVRLLLDEERAASAKRQYFRTLHTQDVPLLRLAGLTLLAGCVIVDASIGARAPSFPLPVQILIGTLALYGFVSWFLLRAYYRHVDTRRTPIDFPVVVQAFDLFACLAAVHLTGGSQSWLFFTLFFHVSDHANTTTTRVAFFAVMTCASYAGYLFVLRMLDVPVSWPIEAAKLVTMAAFSVYIYLITRPAQRHRQRMAATVRYARSLAAMVQEQERELDAAKQTARLATRGQREMLTNVLHELPPRLRTINAMHDVLLESSLAPRTLDTVKQAHAASTRLMEAMDDVLLISRLDAGLEPCTMLPYRTLAPLLEAFDLFRPIAETRGIKLRWQIDPRLPSLSVGDPSRIRYILVKVLDNAVKYNEPGGRVDVRVVYDQVAEMVRVEVEDTGVGLTETYRRRVFDPFFQANRDLRDQIKEGSGLGLTIAKRMVELIGGEIGVVSEPRRGSTFWFTYGALAYEGAAEDFMTLQGPEDERFVVQPRDLEEAVWLPPRRVPAASRDDLLGPVLVGDDNLYHLIIASRLLEHVGYKADCCQSGSQVLARLATRPYRLLLLDCHMPIEDGFVITAMIRERWPHTHPVVIGTTALDVETARPLAARAGMTACIRKPHTLAEVREVLARWYPKDGA